MVSRMTCSVSDAITFPVLFPIYFDRVINTLTWRISADSSSACLAHGQPACALGFVFWLHNQKRQTQPRYSYYYCCTL